MITLPRLAAEALGSFLASDMKDRFGVSHARLAEIVPFAAQLCARMHRQQRRALPRRRAHHARHPRRPRDLQGARAAPRRDAVRLFPFHRRLPPARHRLCARHRPRRRRGRVRRRRGRQQGHAAARRLRRSARALSCRALEAVRPRPPVDDRGARRPADRQRHRAHALSLFGVARRIPTSWRRPSSCARPT